ncbi:MAG: hypothetical protein ACR2PQ_05550 [Myxococcota bacterium]
MERQSQTAAYEVRCHRCDCSFAPGTKRCLHCGERIGRPVQIVGLPGLDERDEDGESETMGSPTFLRGAMWALTAIVAMIMTALRACQGG